jgi:hypothetical protein
VKNAKNRFREIYKPVILELLAGICATTEASLVWLENGIARADASWTIALVVTNRIARLRVEQ